MLAFICTLSVASSVDCVMSNCSGNGVCIHGQCMCFKGYRGNACSVPDKINVTQICAKDCSSHGVYDVETHRCVCERHFTGEDCETGNASWEGMPFKANVIIHNRLLPPASPVASNPFCSTNVQLLLPLVMQVGVLINSVAVKEVSTMHQNCPPLSQDCPPWPLCGLPMLWTSNLLLSTTKQDCNGIAIAEFNYSVFDLVQLETHLSGGKP